MHIFRVSFNVALIVQSLILVVDSRPRRATARIGWWGHGGKRGLARLRDLPKGFRSGEGLTEGSMPHSCLKDSSSAGHMWEVDVDREEAVGLMPSKHVFPPVQSLRINAAKN